MVTPAEMGVEALEINNLDPLICHWSPSRVAVDSVARESEPAFVSVNPNAHNAFPVQSLGKYFFLCSSVPYLYKGPIPSELWEAKTAACELSTRANSSTAIINDK